MAVVRTDTSSGGEAQWPLGPGGTFAWLTIYENVFLYRVNQGGTMTDAVLAEAAVAEAPGVWSIRVPFPDNPLGYTLVYALETAAGGPVLIDAGWDDPVSLAALERGLSAIGTAVADVQGGLVTHHHPDHHGLAGRLRELRGWRIRLPARGGQMGDKGPTAPP